MFVYSALPKIRQPYDFLASVYSYQLVGPTPGLIIATVLPWLELGIGICLIGGMLLTGSLFISVCLASIFVSAIGSALYRGLDISCGCFATSAPDMISFLTLTRAICIMVLSIFAYFGTILSAPRVPQEVTLNSRFGPAIPSVSPPHDTPWISS